MVVICYASDIMEYDRRTPELSNAALHMNEDTQHQYRDIEQYPWPASPKDNSIKT